LMKNSPFRAEELRARRPLTPESAEMAIFRDNCKERK
jgi:hypothetical protein